MIRHIGLLAALGTLLALLGFGLNPDPGLSSDAVANEPLPASNGLAWND